MAGAMKDASLDQNRPRRLLTRKEAAHYCGVSETTFARLCEIRPVLLGDYSARLQRYDIRDIDAWIDERKAANSNERHSKDDIIDGLLQ